MLRWAGVRPEEMSDPCDVEDGADWPGGADQADCATLGPGTAVVAYEQSQYGGVGERDL
ncbi:hypothetical protein GCM10010349_73550 [Streptomyces flavofungini]|nr:hypothetical protein GCM10010349_73550 [Streptomyces flavofungini]